MQWFRWYHGTASDPKFGGIARRSRQTRERVVFVWAMLLESASEGEPRGVYSVTADDIADVLHCETSDIDAVLACMQDAGMIAGSSIHAWEKRQAARDDSAARQRKKRERDADVTRTPRDSNAHVTRQDLDTDTDTDRKKKEGDACASVTPSGPDPVARMVEAWNAMAADAGLSRVDLVNTSRRTAAMARLKDLGMPRDGPDAALEGWSHALRKIAASPFLTGRNDRGWRATFDVMTTPSKFTRLMEGAYDAAPGTGNAINDAFEELARGLH